MRCAKRQRIVADAAHDAAVPSTASSAAALADGWALLHPHAQDAINSIRDFADCQIRVGDSTVFTGLHRVKLAEASTVLRTMITSVDDSSTITLHGDTPKQVALMVSLIYQFNHCSLKDATVDDTLTMCKKYDLVNIQRIAAAHVDNAKLTPESFPQWLTIAARHDLQPAVKRCLKYTGQYANFLKTLQQNPNDEWMDDLPAPVLRQLVMVPVRYICAGHISRGY